MQHQSRGPSQSEEELEAVNPISCSFDNYSTWSSGILEHARGRLTHHPWQRIFLLLLALSNLSLGLSSDTRTQVHVLHNPRRKILVGRRGKVLVSDKICVVSCCGAGTVVPLYTSIDLNPVRLCSRNMSTESINATLGTW